MENLMTVLTHNPIISVGVGAFACGVALFYLVMRRTQKHRQAAASEE